MPKISVIVPVYNVEKYLNRCIDSILNQTFTDFELILIDDGSPDTCPSICDEYAKQDNRVFVIHQKNGGLSVARNAGIDWSFSNSNSEWLTFIDSDDWIHTQYLEFLYNSAVSTNNKVSICSYSRIENQNDFNIEKLDFQYKIYSTEKFFCENRVNAIVAWGKLYAKECFKKIRYPLSKIHEDEFVTYRIIFKYSDITFVNIPLYAYFINSSSIMNTIWNPKRISLIKALKSQVKFFKKNKLKSAYNIILIVYINFVLEFYKELKKYNNIKFIFLKIKLKLKSIYLFFRYYKYIKKSSDYVFDIYMQEYNKFVKPFYLLKK